MTKKLPFNFVSASVKEIIIYSHIITFYDSYNLGTFTILLTCTSKNTTCKIIYKKKKKCFN